MISPSIHPTVLNIIKQNLVAFIHHRHDDHKNDQVSQSGGSNFGRVNLRPSIGQSMHFTSMSKFNLQTKLTPQFGISQTSLTCISLYESDKHNYSNQTRERGEIEGHKKLIGGKAKGNEPLDDLEGGASHSSIKILSSHHEMIDQMLLLSTNH